MKPKEYNFSKWQKKALWKWENGLGPDPNIHFEFWDTEGIRDYHEYKNRKMDIKLFKENRKNNFEWRNWFVPWFKLRFPETNNWDEDDERWSYNFQQNRRKLLKKDRPKRYTKKQRTTKWARSKDKQGNLRYWLRDIHTNLDEVN